MAARPSSQQPIGLASRLRNTISQNYLLGFTSFGGPPVHFKIVGLQSPIINKSYCIIVSNNSTLSSSTIDEQVYQELFSICQAFSGPASTKMFYCINLIHDGFIPAVLSFFLWSLPGALGMYGLSVGVSNIGTALPKPVYALLSGLNASTVGIIILAAVQLSEKAITDKMTRILVFLGACAGLLYNALWYFPLIIFLAGIAAIIHDFQWLHRPIKAIVATFKRMKRRLQQSTAAKASEENGRTASASPAMSLTNTRAHPDDEPRVIPPERRLNFSWKFGLGVILCFFVTFIVIMVLRGTLRAKPLLFSFFANMYLAGTIIFGGGPVVIPLLREY
ncbi:hypothetical protein Golomagni_06908, partial [Golovinomyces magnicellulatus]